MALVDELRLAVRQVQVERNTHVLGRHAGLLDEGLRRGRDVHRVGTTLVHKGDGPAGRGDLEDVYASCGPAHERQPSLAGRRS